MNNYGSYSKVYFTWDNVILISVANVALLYTIAIKQEDIVGYIVTFAIVNMLTYILFSYGMFYFILQKEYLAVKNSWIVWKEVRYPIEEVIKLEKRTGMRGGLKVLVHTTKRVRAFNCNRESDIDKLIEDFYSIKDSER